MNDQDLFYDKAIADACEAAIARIIEHINRSVGQHLRRVREGFEVLRAAG